MNIRPDLSVVGKRQPRLDGREKVSGRSIFTDDVELPGMLHGKILRSPHARARIKSIDTSKAKKLPGVKAVVTADDAPGLMFGENQPLLCQDVVNYVGEEIAAVAAIDEVTAEEARELIEVEYEPLPSVTSLKKALRPDAPQIHGQSPGNIALTFDKDWGDPDKTFAGCEHIFVDEFKSPPQHNTLAELHVAVADFSRPDRLSMWTPTQSAATYKIGLAKAFALSESQVHIAYLNIGGAFTGRGTPKPHHLIAALLSRTTARPVKVRASGDEEFIMFRSSGEIMYRFRTGVDKDGMVKAIEADITIESGAHPERGMLVWLPAGYFNWLYTVESVRYRGRMVYTNNVPRASHHGGIFGRRYPDGSS
jgi:CO/xanthine dehydrogenase Mo-binding subunit